MDSQLAGIDLAVWLNAPKERTAAYFSTYASISRALQASLRGWVRDWFHINSTTLRNPLSALSILVYCSTYPFTGRSTNTFTHDVQQAESINRALASAARHLNRELKSLSNGHQPWNIGNRYFANRPQDVINYVSRNRRLLCRMFNAETSLMNAVLKFAVIDIPRIGLDEASSNVRNTFSVHLNRFSSEFEFGHRTDELLLVATNELLESDRINLQRHIGMADNQTRSNPKR